MTDSIQFEIFEIKQKFLREIPHPKLILKQINLLENKGQLKPINTISYKNIPLTNKQKLTELASFLEEYIDITLNLKQNIASASNYLTLRNVLIDLFKNQLTLLKKLQSYVQQTTHFNDSTIKMSTPIDAYQVLKTIRQTNLQEKEIKDYLCQQINKSELALNSLFEACLRANKIINHG